MASNSLSPPNNTPSDPNQKPSPSQSVLLNLIRKFSSSKPSSESEHPTSNIISFSDPAALSSPSDSNCEASIDNLILDGFLKNNGGYLDDSDSSEPEDAEDYHPNELNYHKHTIRVLAKKYQHEIDSNDSISNPLMGINPTIKLFRFNLNHHDHHHQNVSTVKNKQLDQQTITKKDRTAHHNYPMTPSLDIDHLNRSNQALNGQHSQVENDKSIHFVRNKNLNFKFSQINPSLNQPSKSNRHQDTNHHLTQDEGWNLNFKYIQSSTFPTKNSIIDPYLQQDHHGRRPLVTVPAKNDSYVKKSKSPFRNLFLGQDDLLRSK